MILQSLIKNKVVKSANPNFFPNNNLTIDYLLKIHLLFTHNHKMSNSDISSHFLPQFSLHYYLSSIQQSLQTSEITSQSNLPTSPKSPQNPLIRHQFPKKINFEFHILISTNNKQLIHLFYKKSLKRQNQSSQMISKHQFIIIFLSLVINSLTLSLPQHNNSSITKLAIIITNDLHGTAFPKQFHRIDTNQLYRYGGLIYMARLINIIKQQYGNHSIYFDTGDQIQGSFQSGIKASKGQIIADFFNLMDLQASALGNHQFDFQQDILFNYLKKRKSPTLAANIFSEMGQPNFLPKHKSSQIFDLDGIKIGVIGLITTQTPKTTSSFTLGKYPKYQFHDYPQITIRQATKLRNQGADIIITLAHFGNKCPSNKKYDIRTNQTIQQECQNDQVINFIDHLPEQTIDAVLCGHRHKFTHHWYKNIPFVGAIDGGSYFNILYLYYDRTAKKVVKTEIEGPIPVCQKIFSNTKTCQFMKIYQLLTAGQLTTWNFHNKSVYADPQIQKLFNQKYGTLIDQFKTKIVDNQMILNIQKNKQNSISNIITSLMLKATHQLNINTSFSLINYGFFNSIWLPGPIQHLHFDTMFPFDDNIIVFQIQGKYLLEMLKRIQSGKQEFYFVDGIKQVLSINKILANNGINYHVTKKLINATFLNGQPINSQQFYTGVTVQFLLDGGDDFSKVFTDSVINPQTNTYFQKIPIRNRTVLGNQLQIILNELKKLETIRQKDWQINNQRMVVIKN